MNKEFKKTFFVCLLAVLLVVSNIVNIKYTNFLNVTVGVEFITYPFTFLCTLLILNMGGKRDAYRGILVAAIIQLLICISYAFITTLGAQTLLPDKALYIDQVFQVNETAILASVFAFTVSNCILIYLYENFKKLNKEIYGLVIGLLGAMIIDAIIFLVITLSNYDPIIVVDMLLGKIIIAVFMTVIITLLFYVLKEKETKVVEIKNVSSNNNDLGLEEIVTEKNNSMKKNTRTVKKENNKNKNNYHNNKPKTNQKKSNTSKSKTNK